MRKSKTTKKPRGRPRKPEGSWKHPFGTRVALYARVSTVDQKTIPIQLEHLREYAARREWTVVLEKHETKSGADAARPARAEILEAARRHEIDVVAVWKLDRWGRSLFDLVSTLKELEERRVAFVSLTEGFDLTTSGGRALAGMLAVFAEFERAVRRERQAAGIARARREGRHLGRPRQIWHKEQRKVRELAAQGLAPRAIAEAVGISRTSVYRVLMNAEGGVHAPHPGSNGKDTHGTKAKNGPL